VKRFFKEMKTLEYTDREPVIIYPPKQEDELVKTSNLPYTNEELQRFFDYIVDHPQHMMYERKAHLELAYLILMFIYTGFRRNEQLSFTLSKIKSVGDIHYFDFTEIIKNSASSIRMVPLHSKLTQLGFIKYAEKQKDVIFTASDTTYQRRFDSILRELGIKSKEREKTFHSCRSTFDSKLMGKIPDSTRLTLMGHKKKGMDAVYVHQLLDEMPMYKAAVEKLDYKLDVTRLKSYLLAELKVLYP
jgi:integrase